MPSNVIRFGTSGWRGIIAEDFTFENVRTAAAAIAQYLKSAAPGVKASDASTPDSPIKVFIGYDTRFLSEHFAAAAADVLTSHGFRALLSPQPVPTPAISYEIRRGGYAGGINFTASHNPALYNGLKYSAAAGAPALPEVTREIEALAGRILHGELPLQGPVKGEETAAKVESADARPAYLEALRKIINLEALRKSGLRLGYDALNGVGTDYVVPLLEEAGITTHALHTERDVLFRGTGPDPSEKNLAELSALVQKEGLDMGISTDGDADRFGIIDRPGGDRDGGFVQPNFILALLFDYLIEVRGFPGGAGKSVATTHLIDAVAEHHHVPLYQTPVGFKYLGQLIVEDKIVLGGEESAGMSVRGHLPEKDGILACLLAAEMVAVRKKSLQEQIRDLYQKVGEYHPVRLNLELTEEIKSSLPSKFERDCPRFDSQKVSKTDRTDGLKLILEDGSWVLFRMSGTEPFCRCYCEARSEKGLAPLVEAARSFIFH